MVYVDSYEREERSGPDPDEAYERSRDDAGEWLDDMIKSWVIELYKANRPHYYRSWDEKLKRHMMEELSRQYDRSYINIARRR